MLHMNADKVDRIIILSLGACFPGATAEWQPKLHCYWCLGAAV